jgi:hypothetical protein
MFALIDQFLAGCHSGWRSRRLLDASTEAVLSVFPIPYDQRTTLSKGITGKLHGQSLVRFRRCAHRHRGGIGLLPALSTETGYKLVTAFVHGNALGVVVDDLKRFLEEREIGFSE